jgi:penicillin-insensitive murein endopeptidase
MTSGHQSHQVGLDADIWLYAPKRLDLTPAERESLSSTNVRTGDQKNVTENWTAEHMEVLKLAASDPRVDRIFITPPAKIWMCENAGKDRAWLTKIRPIWGHNSHFHVRLKCPAGSSDCVPQTPTPSQITSGGDGCDSTLQWWVTAALEPRDPNAPPPVPRRRARDYVMADLPQSCQGVLDSK